MRFSVVFFSFLFIKVNAIVSHQKPPHFIKQPNNRDLIYSFLQSDANEQSLILDCVAEGNPGPRYRWIKNGRNFDWQALGDRISRNQQNGTLVITSLSDEDFGQYQCFAENEHGIATSNAVFVRKLIRNSFTDEIQNMSAIEGKPYKLICLHGWSNSEVSWLIKDEKDGESIISNSRTTVGPDGNLYFSNVTMIDSSKGIGNYYVCSVRSNLRNEFTLGNPIFLRVLQLNNLTTEHSHELVKQYTTKQSEIAEHGKKSEIFCIFGGTPLPKIIWRKNGGAIQWDERVLLNNYGRSILFQSVIFEDEGLYSCEVSNGVGNTQSHSINFRVLAFPRFNIEPTIINSGVDEIVEFHCEASGVPEPRISWIYNGKPIEKGPPNNRRIISLNSIKIRRTMSIDTGNYGCNASNILGYVYKDVYLNVLSIPPEVIEGPGRQGTIVEHSVIMKCKIFGVPKPEIKWYRMGQEVTGNRYKILEQGLQIFHAQYSDAGSYSCLAINKFGQVETIGTLEVKDKTQIIHFPIDYEAFAGNSISLNCKAVSDPALNLTIEWLKQGSSINFEQDTRFSKSNDNSLTISKTSELDSGIYTCLAKTELDEVSALAELIVLDVPNAPELLHVDCQGKNAMITWRPLGDNRSPIIFYTIQYNTSFIPEIWSVAYDKVPATNLNYNIEMSPWANFTFRVIAFNKVGPSSPSSQSEVCTTQPDVPHKNPDNVEGKGTEPNNLVIYWTPMNQIEHNGPGFHYKVSYRPDVEFIKQFIDIEVFNWTQSSLLIPNQPAFQKFLFKVVAINDMGESNVSPTIFLGYSGEDKPEAAPGNFSVLQITGSNSAILNWQPVSLETIHGHLKGYKIQIWTESDGEQEIREFHVKGSSALLNNLKAASQNFAKIVVYNGKYEGPPSDVISICTPEGKPSSVESFEGIPVGSSAILLKWTPPLEKNGVIIGYNITYKTNNGTHILNKFKYINSPNYNIFKASILLPKTLYRFEIYAQTKAASGEKYIIEVETKESSTPKKPTLVVRRDQHNIIRLIWANSFNEDAGCYFYARYRKTNETEWVKTRYELSEDYTVLENLNFTVSYEFYITAVDGVFESKSDIQDIDLSLIVETGTYNEILNYPLQLFGFAFNHVVSNDTIHIDSTPQCSIENNVVHNEYETNDTNDSIDDYDEPNIL